MTDCLSKIYEISNANNDYLLVENIGIGSTKVVNGNPACRFILEEILDSKGNKTNIYNFGYVKDNETLYFKLNEPDTLVLVTKSDTPDDFLVRQDPKTKKLYIITAKQNALYLTASSDTSKVTLKAKFDDSETENNLNSQLWKISCVPTDGLSKVIDSVNHYFASKLKKYGINVIQNLGIYLTVFLIVLTIILLIYFTLGRSSKSNNMDPNMMTPEMMKMFDNMFGQIDSTTEISDSNNLEDDTNSSSEASSDE
jgi:hypothetical protein